MSEFNTYDKASKHQAHTSPPDCAKVHKKGFPLNIFQVAGYMQ